MDEQTETIPLGPAMAALTERQRVYVLAMLSNPLGNPSAWARDAGYPAGGADRNAGYHLSRSAKIEAAATEIARAHLNTFGPALGIGVMMMIARNPSHRDQLKAAAMLANRSGFHEVTEQVVSVTHSDKTGKALTARIEQLAKVLGVDPKPLLGANVQPKLIEGEVVGKD